MPVFVLNRFNSCWAHRFTRVRLNRHPLGGEFARRTGKFIMGQETKMTIEGFEEYQARLLEVVHPFILASIESDTGELKEIIRNTLYDENGSRYFSSSFTRRDEVFASRFFLDFDEIVSSYLSLRDIEVYIRRFPYRDTGVSSLRYLKYHIESYLNEVYIFKERFEAYLTFLQRRYRKSPIGQPVSEVSQNLKELISNSLSNIVTTRGSHVHSRRYFDQDLDRLTFLEMLASDESESETFSVFYELGYKKVRKKWAKQIISNNAAIAQLFDVCCHKLYSALFSAEGQFIFPDDR